MNSRKNNKKAIYEPNHIMKAGLRIWPEMIGELIACRGLIWRLMVRDISSRYKQSVLGILWAFLAPLALMIVFVWIKGKNIIPIGETAMPYAAFVFMGQMVWLLFSQGVMKCANSLVVAGTWLTKINFPREALVFSALGQTIFEFLIRIPLLLVIFAWVDFLPRVTILLVPFALFPLLLFVLGVGFFFAIFNAVIRDIGSALGIILNLGMFVTPVVYPPPTNWPFSFLINFVNPISSFVAAARDLSTAGRITDLAAFSSSTMVAILLFLVGWRLFHLVEPKVAERI